MGTCPLSEHNAIGLHDDVLKRGIHMLGYTENLHLKQTRQSCNPCIVTSAINQCCRTDQSVSFSSADAPIVCDVCNLVRLEFALLCFDLHSTSWLDAYRWILNQSDEKIVIDRILLLVYCGYKYKRHEPSLPFYSTNAYKFSLAHDTAISSS